MKHWKWTHLAWIALVPVTTAPRRAESPGEPRLAKAMLIDTKPPRLQRRLEAYFPGHAQEFLLLARKSDNWTDENGADEYDNEIPGVLVAGDGCSLDISLKIRPSRYTHLLKHRKKGHPPSEFSDLDAGNGFIAARIENPNPCGTLPLNFPPGYTYLVVRKTGDNAYESRLISDAKPDLSSPPLHFTRCNNADHPQAADFADVFLVTDVCNDGLIAAVERNALARARYHAKIGQQLRSHLNLLQSGQRAARAGLPFDPRTDAIALWFACDAGCCYADQ